MSESSAFTKEKKMSEIFDIIQITDIQETALRIVRKSVLPGDRSFVWLVERERGRLCRKRFILLNPMGSSASDMVSRDSAEAKESLA